MESFPQKRCHDQHPDYHESPAKAQKLLDPQQQQQPSAHRLALFTSDTYSMGSATAVGSHPADLAPLGCYFSLAQWQELELQALIYKYMLAGATVPLELILPIKRSILNASPFHHHHHSQTAMLQGGGYQGRSGNGMDPEPGRCRRTDGKKWRCSREADTGHKYCERHVHRGRNRSRKHVESETSSTITTTSADTTTTLAHSQSPPPARDTFHFSHSGNNNVSGGTEGQKVLRHFLDDWPTSISQHQEGPDNNIPGTAVAAATSSTPNVPGNHPSDFSLKLSTPPTPTNSNWSGWGSHGDASTGGGPLAEVLRSSTSSTPAPSPSTLLQSPHYL